MNEYLIKKTEKSISDLMNKTKWGQESSARTLACDLQNEFDELVNEIRIGNVTSSIEEASDLLMISLCCIKKMNPSKEDICEQLITLMLDKIERRYGEVIRSEDMNVTYEVEDECWKNAKKNEKAYLYAFCKNEKCAYYRRITDVVFDKNSGEHKCRFCGKIIENKKENMLLGELRKNREHSLKTIISYIKQYSEGYKIAPRQFMLERSKEDTYYKKYILSSNEKMEVFKKHLSAAYGINSEVLEAFNEKLSENVRDDSFEKNLEEEKMPIEFEIVDRMEKKIAFQARSWNNEMITKYLLSYSKSQIIECMYIVHYNNDKINDLTIELSNMYACPVGCKFCASGALEAPVAYLGVDDYIRQIRTCIHDRGIDPLEFERFYVSFAGIGEPSLVYKIISEGMIEISSLYPNVQFNVATIGIDPDCFAYWGIHNDNIRTIQIPCFAITLDKLRSIVANIPNNYDLKEVLNKAIGYKKNHNQCRIKINYIVIEGFNDSDEYIDELCGFLEPYREDIVVKVSYLNETIPGKKYGLRSPTEKRMCEILAQIARRRCCCYIFGTKENTELGCGQLVQNYILEH